VLNVTAMRGRVHFLEARVPGRKKTADGPIRPPLDAHSVMRDPGLDEVDPLALANHHLEYLPTNGPLLQLPPPAPLPGPRGRFMRLPTPERWWRWRRAPSARAVLEHFMRAPRGAEVVIQVPEKGWLGKVFGRAGLPLPEQYTIIDRAAHNEVTIVPPQVLGGGEVLRDNVDHGETPWPHLNDNTRPVIFRYKWWPRTPDQ
jgi:hypothetical protein